MTRNGLFHTRTAPNPLDPAGMREDGPDDPRSIPVRITSAAPDGTLSVEFPDGSTADGQPEGTAPGQVSRADGMTVAQADALRSMFAGLLSDPDPRVRATADAVRTVLTGSGRRAKAQQLAAVAQDPQAASGDRVQALSLLAVLLLSR
jgi:hypothetical protein